MSRPPKVTKKQLVDALTAAGGNLVVAAVILEVNPSTVYRAMQRYDVRVEEYRRIVAA